MSGQDGALIIVDTMVPNADKAEVGGVPAPSNVPAPKPKPFKDGDALAGSGTGGGMGASLLQVGAGVPGQTVATDATGARAGASARSQVAANVKAMGALVPALKDALPDALAQPVVDGLSDVLLPDVHTLLVSNLQEALPAALIDYLNATVTYGVEEALDRALPIAISEAVLDGLTGLVPGPVARVTTAAAARLVARQVSTHVAQGVVRAMHASSSTVVVSCDRCHRLALDCHACAAAERWRDDAVARAAHLSDWFGGFYSEFWATAWEADNGGDAGVVAGMPQAAATAAPAAGGGGK